MIALDTNVLVRFFVGDVPEQARAARELLTELGPDNNGYVSREVAVELVWVLERVYRFPRARVADALLALVHAAAIDVEQRAAVAYAAELYRYGGVDFADVMILLAAQWKEALPLHTFDRRLARLNGVTLIPS